jgi:hypothetical protein
MFSLTMQLYVPRHHARIALRDCGLKRRSSSVPFQMQADEQVVKNSLRLFHKNNIIQAGN